MVAGGVGRATTGITEQAASIDEAPAPLKPAMDNGGNMHNRVWLGGNYWANPMEDWRVADGGGGVFKSLRKQKYSFPDASIEQARKRV